MPRSIEISHRVTATSIFGIFFIVLHLTQIISAQANGVNYCQNDTVLFSDYRAKNLTSVPADIPLNTTVLDLSQNRLTIIKDNIFYLFQYLEQLNLSKNQINTMEARSFFGLHNLCYLDLSENPLSVKSFPMTVFSSIPNLKVLHMSNTVDVYPEQPLQYLVNLQLLSLSAVNGLRFGPGFGFMRKLDELHIIGGLTDTLYNNTFTVFSNTSLRRLTVQNCRLQYIENGAFIPLKRLISLSFENTGIGLSAAEGSFYGLQYRNMTDIIFRHIRASMYRFEDLILDKAKMKYLRTICVSNLDFGDTFISYIELGFFSSFLYPDCVKKLSLRNHRLTSISFGISEILLFRQLQYLDVKAGCAEQKSLISQSRRWKSVNTNGITSENKGVNFTVSAPPNVTYLDLSYVRHECEDRVQAANTKNLLFLDMSYNGLTNCRIPFLDTLSVKVLNFSGSDCSSLPVDLLHNFPSLEVLEMNALNLNLGLLSDTNGILLKKQLDLKSLSMSDNGLTNLHKDLFVNQKLTTSLNLINNKFKEIPNSVRHMGALKSLDMSFNAFTNLNKLDRIWLEKMSKDTNLSVSFQGNPFLCVCSTVEFTRWILETDVDFVDKEKLRCTLTNGTMVGIAALKEYLKDFEIGCKSKFWLIFSVTTASLMCIGLALGIIGYRYRHNIKYWFLTKCRRPRNYQVLSHFNYDAFVGYNHHDYRWVCHRLREFLENQRGYRLCLHHRDFLAGESIQQNIVDSINSSRKTILVISLEFLRCDWGEFEIQMAGMRMVQEGRENAVVVVLLEDIPVGQMPRSLINMWKNVTFLLWSDQPGDEAFFWERLDQSMRLNTEIDTL